MGIWESLFPQGSVPVTSHSCASGMYFVGRLVLPDQQLLFQKTVMKLSKLKEWGTNTDKVLQGFLKHWIMAHSPTPSDSKGVLSLTLAGYEHSGL